jgi:hypothetical protein
MAFDLQALDIDFCGAIPHQVLQLNAMPIHNVISAMLLAIKACLMLLENKGLVASVRHQLRNIS